MSPTRHTITANQSGTYNGMDYDLEYEITFSFTPDGGGWDIHFISVDPDAGDHGVFTDIAQRGLVDWATDWMDEHMDECVALAEAERQHDDDYARGQAADMRREERGR